MSDQPLLIPELSYHALPVIGWRQWVASRRHGAGILEHHEYRSEFVEVIECEKCGGRVELWHDTEEWVQDEKVNCKWRHESFGPVAGFCESCPTAYHDGFDCMYVLDLSDQVKA